MSLFSLGHCEACAENEGGNGETKGVRIKNSRSALLPSAFPCHRASTGEALDRKSMNQLLIDSAASYPCESNIRARP